MSEAVTRKIIFKDYEVVEKIQNLLSEPAHLELSDAGSFILREDVSRISDNGGFDLTIPLICRDGSVVVDVKFEDLVLLLSEWCPSSCDIPTSEAVLQLLGYLGNHCLPASFQESGDIIIREMLPIAVEKCAMKDHCAHLIDRMVWSHHLHGCAIGLAYGVSDPLIQDELISYMDTYFEDSWNVALLLC